MCSDGDKRLFSIAYPIVSPRISPSLTLPLPIKLNVNYSLSGRLKDDDLSIGVAQKHGDVVVTAQSHEPLHLCHKGLSLEQENVPSISSSFELLQIHCLGFPESSFFKISWIDNLEAFALIPVLVERKRPFSELERAWRLEHKLEVVVDDVDLESSRFREVSLFLSIVNSDHAVYLVEVDHPRSPPHWLVVVVLELPAFDLAVDASPDQEVLDGSELQHSPLLFGRAQGFVLILVQALSGLARGLLGSDNHRVIFAFFLAFVSVVCDFL